MIRLIYLINITLINLISRYTLYIFHSFINSTLQLYSKYQDYNCEYLWINSSFRKSMNLFWTNGGKKKENSINQSIIMQSILVQSIPSPLRPSPPPVRIEAIQFLVLFHRASPDTLFGRSTREGRGRGRGRGILLLSARGSERTSGMRPPGGDVGALYRRASLHRAALNIVV